MGNGARKVLVDSYNGTRYPQHNDKNFVTVSQILLQIGQFSVEKPSSDRVLDKPCSCSRPL